MYICDDTLIYCGDGDIHKYEYWLHSFFLHSVLAYAVIICLIYALSLNRHFTFYRLSSYNCYNHFTISSVTSVISPSFIWPHHSRNYRANLHLHVGTSVASSANSIVTNDSRVEFRKCRLFPFRYVKSRVSHM